MYIYIYIYVYICIYTRVYVMTKSIINDYVIHNGSVITCPVVVVHQQLINYQYIAPPPPRGDTRTHTHTHTHTHTYIYICV